MTSTLRTYALRTSTLRTSTLRTYALRTSTLRTSALRRRGDTTQRTLVELSDSRVSRPEGLRHYMFNKTAKHKMISDGNRLPLSTTSLQIVSGYRNGSAAKDKRRRPQKTRATAPLKTLKGVQTFMHHSSSETLKAWAGSSGGRGCSGASGPCTRALSCGFKERRGATDLHSSGGRPAGRGPDTMPDPPAEHGRSPVGPGLPQVLLSPADLQTHTTLCFDQLYVRCLHTGSLWQQHEKRSAVRRGRSLSELADTHPPGGFSPCPAGGHRSRAPCRPLLALRRRPTAPCPSAPQTPHLEDDTQSLRGRLDNTSCPHVWNPTAAGSPHIMQHSSHGNKAATAAAEEEDLKRSLAPTCTRDSARPVPAALSRSLRSAKARAIFSSIRWSFLFSALFSRWHCDIWRLTTALQISATAALASTSMMEASWVWKARRAMALLLPAPSCSVPTEAPLRGVRAVMYYSGGITLVV
ncbi:hypothetical protein CRUP_026740 [Coryphaenoides rupestris]|nr:hypothetical protein CRUP_026740 [Coryphaenoides rupestris]